MLHERAAIWGDAKELHGVRFCWTGRCGKMPKEYRDGDRSSDHLVNVLAAQCSKDGFDVDALMKTYAEWTAPVPTDDVKTEAEDGGKK